MADEELQKSAAGPSASAETNEKTASADSSQEAVESTSAELRTAQKAEPEVILSPKERRQVLRTKRAAKVGSRLAVGVEERQAERDALRKQKAGARRVRREAERTAYQAAQHEHVATSAREHVAGIQKMRQGVVVSDKADKTVTVRIDVARRHRKYQKIVRTSTTVHAHDESNDAHIGDIVVVREARPLSRTKRWRLVKVVERAK
ncbi:MAG: 30S ribosomal protein S17 [Solirubrobacteraceae bacterium]